MMKYEEEAALFPHHDDQIIYQFVFKIEIDRLKESAFFFFAFFFVPLMQLKVLCIYSAEKQQVIPFKGGWSCCVSALQLDKWLQLSINYYNCDNLFSVD